MACIATMLRMLASIYFRSLRLTSPISPLAVNPSSKTYHRLRRMHLLRDSQQRSCGAFRTASSAPGANKWQQRRSRQQLEQLQFVMFGGVRCVQLQHNPKYIAKIYRVYPPVMANCLFSFSVKRHLKNSLLSTELHVLIVAQNVYGICSSKLEWSRAGYVNKRSRPARVICVLGTIGNLPSMSGQQFLNHKAAELVIKCWVRQQ